jgi:hypothetical protein
MKVRHISTEEPFTEQWRLLTQYSHEATINRYFTDHHFHVSPDIVEHISATLRQAHAYFLATRDSPLDISPLLAYYGASNLLSGVAALTTGVLPAIDSHGMDVDALSVGGRIADVVIRTHGSGTGAIAVFSQIFCAATAFPGGSKWPLLAMLASIPEIREDFETSYPTLPTRTVPVATTIFKGARIDRVQIADMQRHPSPTDALTSISGYKDVYLPPERAGDALVLCRQLWASRDIQYDSCLGGRYLILPATGHSTAPPVLLAFIVALFALGHLSRYYAATWNKAMRLDPHNERGIIERLISVAGRYIPNEMLTRIVGERVIFGPRAMATLSSVATDEQHLRRMIREQLDEIKDEG